MELSVQLLAPPALPPGELGPSTHWIGSLVGLRAGLDDGNNRIILSLPGIESGPSSP
jgi:hypothetical protein